MNQTGSKPNQPNKIDPSQSFESFDSLINDLKQSLKDDLGKGIFEDAAVQTKLKTPIEKIEQSQEKSQSIAQKVFGEKLLVDLGLERKKQEIEEKKVAEAQQIEQLSAEIRQVAQIQEAKIEGAVEQLRETQVEMAKEESFSITTTVEQQPQKVGIYHLILEKFKLKWLRQKIDSSKTWAQTGQGKRERAATGMEVFIKGKQMQGLEQQVWQHQG